MTLAGLTLFLGQYGLLFLLPLATVEGPIVTLLSGVLSGRGILDWAYALPLLVAGDLIGDALYYAIGRYSKSRLHRLALRLGLPVERAEAFGARVAERSTRMLLIGKWTHAIGALVLIAAGAARVNLTRFLLVNLLATIPKTALLFFVGSYAGAHFLAMANRFGFAALGLLLVGLLAAYLVLRRPGWVGDRVT